MVGRIYTLRDPITNKIRYVGQTRQDLKIRANQHWRDRYQKKEANQHKANWISKLHVEHKIKPIIELVEEFSEISDIDLNIKENFWMNYYWNEGCDLTNTSGKFYHRVVKKHKPTTGKVVYCYDKLKKEYVYNSCREASRQLRIDPKIISGVVSGIKANCKWLFSFSKKSEKEIQEYFDKRIRRNSPVKITNLETGESTIYKNQAEASKLVDINFRIISSRLKNDNKKPYLNKYIIENE